MENGLSNGFLWLQKSRSSFSLIGCWDSTPFRQYIIHKLYIIVQQYSEHNAKIYVYCTYNLQRRTTQLVVRYMYQIPLNFHTFILSWTYIFSLLRYFVRNCTFCAFISKISFTSWWASLSLAIFNFHFLASCSANHVVCDVGKYCPWIHAWVARVEPYRVLSPGVTLFRGYVNSIKNQKQPEVEIFYHILFSNIFQHASVIAGRLLMTSLLAIRHHLGLWWQFQPSSSQLNELILSFAWLYCIIYSFVVSDSISPWITTVIFACLGK